MLVFRLVLVIALVAVTVSIGVYLLSGDRRYLRFSWQLVKFSAVLLLIGGVLFALGRIILY
ncbi:hypothetical protein ED236_12105 [Pseudomethylobacillus aquaticus]|uniref:Uncharacterized protein n=1 Tax=Pseudomethylobacillus aquaticus TaxID=2676064 RepID=A0A3N0UU85_9PROT|nr:hypothetical protein [Pseudomethylobacillus aquaticus]ROH84129.1 hypothetical protein ED236_12105 [Pseudomethylobacillus aquaticus]